MNIFMGSRNQDEDSPSSLGLFKKFANYTFDPLYTYKVYFVYYIHEQIEFDRNGRRNWEPSSAFHLENPEEKS
jgi:hypothetical protein